MIDLTIFVARMIILEERFGRKLGQAVQLEYRECLDALSTEDFITASKLIFARDTFFPSPIRFLEVLNGDVEAQALEAWTGIMVRASSGAGFSTDPGSKERRILNAATGGNGSAVVGMEPFALERVEKRFIKLWAADDRKQALEAAKPVQALPSAQQASQVLKQIGASFKRVS